MKGAFPMTTPELVKAVQPEAPGVVCDVDELDHVWSELKSSIAKREPSKHPDKTYEQGFLDALEWVFGK
jgi:hypothetical protein